MSHCTICAKTIAPERLRRHPRTRTCSHTCSLRLQQQIQRMHAARRRAELTALDRKVERTLPRGDRQ